MRYNNNEIYFDVVEVLDAIVNKYVLTRRVPLAAFSYRQMDRNGTSATSTVWGAVESNCKLSGNILHTLGTFKEAEGTVV